MNISSGTSGSSVTRLKTTFGKDSFPKDSGTKATPKPAETKDNIEWFWSR